MNENHHGANAGIAHFVKEHPVTTAFVVRSSDREHGGNVIEGVFSNQEKAINKIVELRKEEPYWRIFFCDEYNLETGNIIISNWNRKLLYLLPNKLILYIGI